MSSTGEKIFYQTISAKGGAAYEYQSITESDFAASAGAAYTPPELGVYRRINVSRTIQLLKNVPGTVETFHTSELSYLRLPSGSVATNDALDGRIIYIKNSGTKRLILQNHLGTELANLKVNSTIIAIHNENNNWDIFFAANKNIDYTDITKEPKGYVDRTQCTIDFTDLTMTFTISPIGDNFIYYVDGIEYIKTSTENVTITDTEGLWYIYYDESTLSSSQTPWEFDEAVTFTAIIYWDSTNKKAILFGEERHGLVMDWATHKHKHLTDGAKVEYGTFIADDYIIGGDGTSDSHARLSIGNGRLHDEDLIMEISHSATPTDPFEQNLDPIAYIPMYYRSGSTGAWRKLDATQFPVAYQAGNTCRINTESGGNWSLTNVTNNYIFATWIFATNNIFEPIVAIIGQMESTDLSAASSEDFYTGLDLGEFPFLEATLLYRAFFRTNTSFTNTPNAVLESLDGLLLPNVVPSPVVNYYVISSTTFSTASSSDTLITGFTVTPQAGTYAIDYSSAIKISTNNALAYCTIYKDGSPIVDSVRYTTASGSNFNTMLSTQTIARFDGTEACDVRVKQTSGTNYVYDRSIKLIRLGA